VGEEKRVKSDFTRIFGERGCFDPAGNNVPVGA
jgi:hypothetical protein